MPFMIEFIITKAVSKIVVDKYTALYHQRRKALGRAYPRTQLIANIRSALSCNGDYIDEINIKEPIVNKWKTAKFKVYHYKHWYYAIKLMLSPNGDTIAVAQDALYDGDYHNDTMETKPYESITKKQVIITESRLRHIITETIRKVLYN